MAYIEKEQKRLLHGPNFEEKCRHKVKDASKSPLDISLFGAFK